MNNTKIEVYKVIEVKPGVYLHYGTIGNGELTEDINKAKRYEMDDFTGSSRAARNWFGEVKTLTVVSEVK